ncbi:MAG: hypothetical protein LUQ38_08630 [Methanotrichaceae archaeon]|nr:hypothetical protein [Methanotrichaceae archaeon]
MECISRIADKAAIRAIVHPKDVILGMAFNNMRSESDSDGELYADYVIVEDDMLNAKFMVKSENWPCSTFPVQSSSSILLQLCIRDNEFFKVAIYSEEEKPDMLKSEVIILGEHDSSVGSILRHPSSRDSSTTLEADETESILYGWLWFNLFWVSRTFNARLLMRSILGIRSNPPSCPEVMSSSEIYL